MADYFYFVMEYINILNIDLPVVLYVQYKSILYSEYVRILLLDSMNTQLVQ